MKKTLSIVLILVFVFMLSACDEKSSVKDEMFALDTVITFDLRCNSQEDCTEILNKCKQEVKRLESLLSTTDENSDVYKINNSNSNKIKVSDECAQLIRTSVLLSEKTDGAFDVSLYELKKLWGFDTKQYKVPTQQQLDEALKKSGFKNIEVSDDNYVTLKNSTKIDLGGIAKGYIAHRVHDILKNDKNVTGAIVSFGGMVVAVGENSNRDNKKWTIGVEYPQTSGEYFATFNAFGATTSGSYQRCFEQDGVRYHHIIDPKTGKPSDSDISSVTIVAQADEYADAMSTAFFVMGIDKTIDYLKSDSNINYDVIILSADKKQVYVTQNLFECGFEIESKYKDIIDINVIS